MTNDRRRHRKHGKHGPPFGTSGRHKLGHIYKQGTCWGNARVHAPLAPLKQRTPHPGESRQHRPSPLLDPCILPLNGANPALRMGHMAHPSEPSTRTVKAGNPWAVTDRGGHDHEKEGLCDSHPLHKPLCRICPGGLRWQRRRYRKWRWRRGRDDMSRT